MAQHHYKLRTIPAKALGRSFESSSTFFFGDETNNNATGEGGTNRSQTFKITVIDG